MKTFYTLYAQQSARHNWRVYGFWNNQERAIMNYLKFQQDAPEWTSLIVIVQADYFDNETLDNVKQLPHFPIVDIDAALLRDISLSCPSVDYDTLGAYATHHLPVSISWSELQEIGGFLLCEMCESRMVLTSELNK